MDVLTRTLAVAALALASATEKTAAEFHVAPSGNDAGSGTAAQPFATLERARDAVRSLKSEPGALPAGGVTVWVRGGVYALERSLVFTPADSGTPEAPVVYAAWPGETPILSGGVALRDWTVTAEGHWQTVVPGVKEGEWRFSQVYVNDQRRFRPAWPAEGYVFIAGQVPPSKPGLEDGFAYHAGDIDPAWHNLGDIEAVIVHQWTVSRLPLRSVDPETRVVRFTGTTQNDSFAALTTRQWYHLENVREALRKPGQWYLDRQSGLLTYIPMPGEDRGSAQVVAPRLRQVVEFRGDPATGLFVEHIVLRGLTIAHSAWNTPANGYREGQSDCSEDAAVTATAARHCVLERCVVRHTGNHGLEFGAGCVECRAESCELVDLGMGGIKIGTFLYPDEPDPGKWAAGCTVRDCLIRGGGRVNPSGCGVLIGHASHNLVARNEVRDMYYSGVSVGWRWDKGFSPGHHNVIAFNHLHTLGQDVLSDMAGIYCLGQAPGTVLQGNHIHDVSRSTYGGWGIYFDAESRGVVATGNLVYRTEDGGLHQNYGTDNVVRGNLFAFGKNGQIRCSDLGKSGRTTIEHNVFVWRSGKLFETPPGDLGKLEFRGNHYWCLEGDAIFPTGKDKAAWQAREPDFTAGELPFADVANCDFRFTNARHALDNAFVPLDPARAGRISQRDVTASLPPVPPAYAPAPEPFSLPAVGSGWREGFEACLPGQAPLMFESWANKPGSCVVTDETAASGRLSLKFTDTQPGESEPGWQPHVFRQVAVKDGVAVMGFAIRVGKGAQARLEWRHYDDAFGGHGYRVGPNLEVGPDGRVTAGDRAIGQVPLDTWVTLAVRCGVGKRADGTFAVVVQVPGNDAPLQAEALPCQEGFTEFTWLGWMAVGEPGSCFTIDDLSVQSAGE
jgi:hypothetical protein